ncbi:MAG: hypothetical protein J6P61_04055 [Erysipelotrichaceae bacterium]|nr:hypothetical protein [Erysipelotrichaceae bacterium]
MKTLFINGSPKKKLSASSYFIALQKLFVKGQKVSLNLRTKADYQPILNELHNVDNVVFCLPLYVDGVPSHVLRFMEVMESYCSDNNLHCHVYVIANNGFIEGRQNEPLMQVFEHFCTRANLTFGGGVGVGGGVMLNVTRILFFVDIALLLLNIILSVVHSGNFFPVESWISFIENALLLLFFNCGVLFYLCRMGMKMNKGEIAGKKYTRIMLPSFVFIIFADIFFIIVSIFEGGLFRGWLSKKSLDHPIA